MGGGACFEVKNNASIHKKNNPYDSRGLIKASEVKRCVFVRKISIFKTNK